MPELPEVEVTRLALERCLMGQVLVGATVRNARLRYPVSRQLTDTTPNPILALARRGKYLIIETRRAAIMVHLGMSGTLRYLSHPLVPGPHDHVDLLLAQGGCLRYRDPRRFGALLWLDSAPDGEEVRGWMMDERLQRLGPEPFDPALTAEHWYRSTRGKTQEVKRWLMEGRAVVGAGNIYAAESLFLAGIDPRRSIGSLSRMRYARLLVALRQVLTQAIEAGGSTLRDFVDGQGESGYFQLQHCVYGRAGEPCLVCATPLRLIRQAQRATVYCPVCQR